MGLPLACQIARRGAHVVACDVRSDVVEAINRAVSPIEGAWYPGIAVGRWSAKAVLSASTNTPAGPWLESDAGGGDCSCVC